MKLSNFNYNYPNDLIATEPLKDRDASRMMILNRADKSIKHGFIKDFPNFLKKGDVVVINDTRVFPARLIGKKETGGSIEILLLKPYVSPPFKGELEGVAIKLSTTLPFPPLKGRETTWTAITNQTAKLKAGTKLFFGKIVATVTGRDGDNILVDIDKPELIEQVGVPPVPPYIRSARNCHSRENGNLTELHAGDPLFRGDDKSDKERYQTVFAKHTGSAAAPTAGLHFSDKLLESIKNTGAKIAPITLHVGLDTFSPVRVDTIENHKMHGEEFFISKESLDTIKSAKTNGGRIIAIGTTSTRALESINLSTYEPKHLSTNIFIYPGYKFKNVDAMVTNFHQPESTLIMMVSAFAERSFIMKAYQKAILKNYRLFSYGDCMLIL